MWSAVQNTLVFSPSQDKSVSSAQQAFSEAGQGVGRGGSCKKCGFSSFVHDTTWSRSLNCDRCLRFDSWPHKSLRSQLWQLVVFLVLWQTVLRLHTRVVCVHVFDVALVWVQVNFLLDIYLNDRYWAGVTTGRTPTKGNCDCREFTKKENTKLAKHFSLQCWTVQMRIPVEIIWAGGIFVHSSSTDVSLQWIIWILCAITSLCISWVQETFSGWQLSFMVGRWWQAEFCCSIPFQWLRLVGSLISTTDVVTAGKGGFVEKKLTRFFRAICRNSFECK